MVSSRAREFHRQLLSVSIADVQEQACRMARDVSGRRV
jgi:hypothetical protein